MSVYPQHIEELLRLLETSSELRAMLRALLLSEELLALPQIVRSLATAQERTAEQLRSFEAAMERTLSVLTAQVTSLAQEVEMLAREVRALTERMERVEAQIAALTERMERVEAQIAALTERMERVEKRLEQVEQRFGRVEQRLDRVERDVGRLKGLTLPLVLERRIGGLLRALVRSPRVLPPEELTKLLEEAEERGQLSEYEVQQLLQADLVVLGRAVEDRRKQRFVVCEVSWGVGSSDVQRARERAALLQRLGNDVAAAVIGVWLTPEGQTILDGVHFVAVPESMFE